MALSVDVKLVVAKNGTEIGMRKDGDNDFGTFIPNYLGNSMTLVLTAYSDGTDFIVITDGKIDKLGAIALVSASGATLDLQWDAGTSAYKAAVGAFKTVLESHYDGVLELKLHDGAVAQAPQKPTGFAKPTSSAITATGAKIAWKAPTGGDPVTGYKVSVKAGATAIAGSPFTVAKGTLSKTLTGLTTKTAYTVVVTATNGAGSLDAAALTVTTI